MALDQTRANEVLTWMHGGSAPTALTTPIRILLLLETPTASTSTVQGTELATSGSYTHSSAGGSTGGISTGGNWAAASGGSQATNAVISQTGMPAATIVAISIVDSTAGTYKRVEFGNLTASKTTASGDTLSFASGAITSALA